MDRVRDVRPDFELTPVNAASVTAICRRLDALPLALELAAPWMKALTAADLLRRLGNDALLSAASPRDLPERQETMNATVAWSYQLLDADEQRAFRRFGALPGRFPIDAAAAVLAGRGEWTAANDEALRAAAGLMDKSLLVRAGRSVVPTCPLYQMLDTMRAYAVIQLAASVERDDAFEGLVRYCTREASLAADGLLGLEQLHWLDRVREDLESYRGAFAWLIEHDRAAEASDIACRLMIFWVIRGHAAEGLHWYEQMLALPSLRDRARSRVLASAAVMSYTLGALDRARAAVEQALDLAQRVGDVGAAAQSRNLFGHIEHAAGNFEAAREHYTRAVAGFRAIGIPWGVGNSLTGLAVGHLATGNTLEAERLLDEATDVLRDAGPWFLSLTLYVRALMAVRKGQADEAIALARESLERIRLFRDKFAFVFALVPLAAAAVLKGDDAWAARIIGARDAVTERTGATVADVSLQDLRDAEGGVRARLGPDRWAQAYATGRRATIDALLSDIDRGLRRR